MLAALLGTMARPREGAHGGRSGRGLAAPASAPGGRHRWLVASSERSRRRWLVAPSGHYKNAADRGQWLRWPGRPGAWAWLPVVGRL